MQRRYTCKREYECGDPLSSTQTNAHTLCLQTQFVQRCVAWARPSSIIDLFVDGFDDTPLRSASTPYAVALDEGAGQLQFCDHKKFATA